MQHVYSSTYDNVCLRPLERRDIEKLREWRNDKEKTRFLRKINYITPEMQEKWYENYITNTDEITFAIDETKELNRMVGSISLYNFCGDVAEIGKIQIGDDEAHGRGIGRKSFVMASWIGFEILGLNKIVASVHQENTAAHKSDIKAGFEIVGNHIAPMGGIEDEIEIDKQRLKEVNPYINEIIVKY